MFRLSTVKANLLLIRGVDDYWKEEKMFTQLARNFLFAASE